MKKQNKTIILIVSIIVIGVVLYGVLKRESTLNKFSENGIETTATITDIVWKRKREVSGSRRNSVFLEVTFFTKNEKPDSIKNKKTIEKDKDGNISFNFDKLKTNIGEFIKTDIPVQTSESKKLKIGDKVQILYLKDNPEEAILKDNLE